MTPKQKTYRSGEHMRGIRCKLAGASPPGGKVGTRHSSSCDPDAATTFEIRGDVPSKFENEVAQIRSFLIFRVFWG